MDDGLIFGSMNWCVVWKSMGVVSSRRGREGTMKRSNGGEGRRVFMEGGREGCGTREGMKEWKDDVQETAPLQPLFAPFRN
jgi:hypothetical protein